MAFKIDTLKETIGEEAYTKLLGAIKEKEGEAAVAGLTNKEVDDEVDITEKDEEEVLELVEIEDDEAEEGDDIELTEEEVAELDTLVSAFEAGVQPLAERLDELAGLVETTNKKNKELEKTVKELRIQYAATDATLKELTAVTPRAVAKEKRASQADATVTDKEVASPSTDPYITTFINEMFLSPNRGQ